jgi:hypothetical protein
MDGTLPPNLTELFQPFMTSDSYDLTSHHSLTLSQDMDRTLPNLIFEITT